MRAQIVATARRMRDLDLVVASVGNVSARCLTGMLITPTRRHPDDLQPHDVVEISLDGRQLNPGALPSVEWPLHAAIYRARRDVDAIVHTHSPHAVARSFDPAPLPIVTEERLYFDVDRIEVADVAPAGSVELASAAVEALGGRPAVLLARHGVIGVGHEPREALEMCCLVEHQSLIATLVPQQLICVEMPHDERGLT